MLDTQNKASLNSTTIPTFTNKVFDMESYKSLAVLPSKELLATILFSYVMQSDNPLNLFGTDHRFLNDNETIDIQIGVTSSGEILKRTTHLSLFDIELKLNIELLHSAVEHMLEHNPGATKEQIGTYSLDSFLLQITPQIWDESQRFAFNLTESQRDDWCVKAIHYSALCGFSPIDIYEKLLVPMVSMMKNKKKGLN